MKIAKWVMAVLLTICLLMTGCTTENAVTASGSDEWSRGVIVGSTEADPVAVATWEDTTFVAWIAESNRVQLAQLDAALNVESVTDLALTTDYPYHNMSLEAEAADLLHLVWLDSVEGARTIVHARLTPGKADPVSRQEIRLPYEVEHVQFVMRLDARRLEIFWSADENRNSGVHYQTVDLADDTVTSSVQLTDAGWQPAAGRISSGVMEITWLEEERSGYYTIWRADFDLDEHSLDNLSTVTEVRVRRGRRFQGPAVGSAGTQTVVAWSVGWRHSTGLGISLDLPTWDKHIAAGLSRTHGAAANITSDEGAYTIVPALQGQSSVGQGTASVYPLTVGRVAEIWQAPQMRTVGDRAWAFFSAWVAQRSDVRMQIVIVPFDENGAGEPIIVTKTRPSSVWPDLAVGDNGTMRAAWVEPLGNDLYRVVVASTATEAREALGGFRLAEVWNDIATFLFENVSLLGYAPYVIGWMVLPLGVLGLATVLSPSGVRGKKVAVWLGIAVILQLASKRYLAPQMLPFESGLGGIVISAVPVVLGIPLMWIYWRRAKEPLLLAAYSFFIGTDAVFSIFVVLPRIMWGV